MDEHETNMASHFDILLNHVAALEREKKLQKEEHMVSGRITSRCMTQLCSQLPSILLNCKFVSSSLGHIFVAR